MKSLIISSVFISTLAFGYGQNNLNCVEKCVLVPKGFIMDSLINNKSNFCTNFEVIIESHKFKISGFDKYGYNLLIDTSRNNLEFQTQIFGYFDLQNNTDSVVQIHNFGWSIDNMRFELEKRGIILKPKEFVKIKYFIPGGIGRCDQKDIREILKKINYHNYSVVEKLAMIDSKNIMKIFIESKGFYGMSNFLNIGCQYKEGDYKVESFLIMFKIPVRYIISIQYE